MIDQEELFYRLCHLTGRKPNGKGEVFMPCPECGKEGEHFSFSVRGSWCFVCHAKPSLWELWKLLSNEPLEEYRPTVRPVAPKPRAPVPVDTFTALARQYAKHPGRVAAWQVYKPLSEETICAYDLGYGTFPPYTSRCQHPRLMVPLIAGGQVVGFRGRSTGCDCGKWLTPRYSRMVLYNGERLGQGETFGVAVGRREARYVIIVENPLDALLIEEYDPEVVAVATLGVTIWQPEWTQALVALAPDVVAVCFDNDRPGNGGGEAGREAWLATHPKDILPNGVRLANRLLAAGVKNASVLPWAHDAKLKDDIGDVIVGGAFSLMLQEGGNVDLLSAGLVS